MQRNVYKLQTIRIIVFTIDLKMREEIYKSLIKNKNNKRSYIREVAKYFYQMGDLKLLHDNIIL